MIREDSPVLNVLDDIQEWAAWAAIPLADALECVARPDELYIVYPLRRRGKVRWIQAPRPVLKLLQRGLLDGLLYRLRPTDHAHGFVPRRSIVTNAFPHVGRQWVVTLDIKDFFPSITRRQVMLALSALALGPACIDALAGVVTRHGRLPQGAPTSPHLANLVVVKMDQQLAALAAARGWVYTRYADDLTFSGDTRPAGLLDAIKNVLDDHGFRPAPGKSRVMGRDQRQMVTGLVVNDRVRLPKPHRRLLRAMLHQSEGNLADGNFLDPVLEGHLAFAAFVNRTVLQWEISELA